MRSGTAIFTIIAKNYLPYARVLMRSVAEHHPDWPRYVVLVDRVDEYFDPELEDFEIVKSSDLPIPRSLWFHFKYTILELSTAVKPYAFEYFFENHAFDRIIYLDPDIRVYSALDAVTQALESANIVLTPHLTSSLEDGMKPAEIDILRSGAYNLGFLAIAKSKESAAFLAWWRQRLYDHCVVDLPRGLFVDQRWIDLVPGMFDGVVVLRDGGYNVAYWNLSHRRVSHSSGGYTVAGSALSFFHFSGYEADHPDTLSRHQNRHVVQDLPAATRKLLCSYREELLAAGYLKCRRWPYAFATFKNGIVIPDLGRPIHQEAPELVNSIQDPFSDEGYKAFVEVWNGPVQDEKRVPGISRLAYRIYRTRTDVQSAMPDIFGGHYRRFMEWMLVSGKMEHGLGEVFLTTISKAVRNVIDPLHGSNGKERALPVSSLGELGNELVSGPAPENGVPVLKMTRLAAAIYESRPDLQHYFPDPCGRDGVPFLAWLLTHGKRDLGLSAHHLAPMKEQWRFAVGALPRLSSRLRHELILCAMAMPASIRKAGRRILRAKPWQAQGGPTARGSVGLAKLQVAEPARSLFGVNVVGYFGAKTGVGQSARATHEALRAVAVPTSVRCIGDVSSNHKQDQANGEGAMEFPYFTNLFHVNADQTVMVRQSLGDPFYRNRHNIAHWAWELAEFPDRWSSAFSPYQEIWTPSNFCRDAISYKASIPVFRIPYAIAPVAPTGMDRQYFGLTPERFVFLTAFDVLSVMERKNPLATIRAFELAFGANSHCQLVLKINNAGASPTSVETLRNVCSSGAVRIIESSLTREEMYALSRCADCIVSLHRSEGFGLLIAEAMYFGRPVIVTNYSGNTDFTRPDNALLVDYKLIPVGQNCAPYDPDSLWADPDVAQAARHMKRIAGSTDLRATLAGEGSKFVRTTLSTEAVGKMMRQRLDVLRASSVRSLAARAA